MTKVALGNLGLDGRNMKRILYMVACDIGLTGTPLFVRDITEALKDHYEFIVYTPFRQSKKIYSDNVIVIEGCCQGNRQSYYKSLKESLKTTFKDMHIDAVHINTSNVVFTNICVEFFYGKVPVIISHSHSVISYKKDIGHNLLLPILKRNIVRKSTKLLACSDAAGRDMFGGKADYLVIHNFIDVPKFAFFPESRQKIRQGIQYEYVLGHIGAFNRGKNQMFLVKLAQKLDERFCIMLIGNGGLKAECKKYCAEHHVENVYFVDACENVHEYYSAFDMLLLPSRAEGFGRVLLEAEVSNLNKIVSDHVPHSDAFVCTHLPLDENLWIQEIYAQAENLNERTDNSELIRKKGFDMESIAAKLMALYGD